METITYEILARAVRETAVGFRCVTRLEPLGGPGDKLFPPTFGDSVRLPTPVGTDREDRRRTTYAVDLIVQLESFLLEFGGDFAFIGRQRRLRIGDEWYRVDLLFFHRRLRCLVVIDLKLGKFTHADAGQMHLYLNYAREHWTLRDENPPVGLILCAQRDDAVAHYALEGLPIKVLAAEYRTALPDEASLAAELRRTREILERRRPREVGHPDAETREQPPAGRVGRRSSR